MTAKIYTYTAIGATVALMIIVNVFYLQKSEYLGFTKISPYWAQNNTAYTKTTSLGSTMNSIDNTKTTNADNKATTIANNTIPNNKVTEVIITKTAKPSTTTKNLTPKPNHVNPHDFNYTINPSNTCSNIPNLEIIICVPISRNNIQGRRVVSETWGSYADQKGSKAALLFFVGKGDATEPPEVQAAIQKEVKEYNDIVQEDYIDSYRNLSLKSVSILKWVSTYCTNAKFVLKADDDVYVNIPNLLIELNKIRNKSPNLKFITGHLIQGAAPNRDPNSKWYTSKSIYPGKSYPHYVSGTTYAMTLEAARSLYYASLKTKFFWLEDIYITGFCRTEAGVAVQGSGLITYEKPKPSGCEFRKRITGHRYNEAQLRYIHKQLYDKDLSCN